LKIKKNRYFDSFALLTRIINLLNPGYIVNIVSLISKIQELPVVGKSKIKEIEKFNGP